MTKTPFEDWTHDQLVEFARKAQALVEELELGNKVLQDQLKKNADYIMKLSGAHHDRT